VSQINEILSKFTATLSSREKAVMSNLLDIGLGDGPLKVLGTKLPDEILTLDEIEIYNNLCSEPLSIATSMRSYTVMVMKATRLCNLRCNYCHSWREGANQTMDFSVLARAIRDSLLASATRHVEFVWHGS
jgi:uncharacterized protein